MMSVPPRVLTALHSLLSALDWRDAPLHVLQVEDGRNLLPTCLPVASCAAAVLSATGLAAAAVHAQRGSGEARVVVDMRRAALATANADYLRVDGKVVKSWDTLTGYYRARSEDWVYLHGNFPHLRDGLLRLFGVPNERTALAAAVAQWDADEVEQQAGERGLCAVKVRTRDAWQRHPQHAAALAVPVVSVRRIGDAPPVPLAAAARPLDGVRVLDLSRVIAGPMIGRTLGQHGATVMRIGAPHLPSLQPLVIDTGFGKLAANLDLRDARDAARLRELARQADVFVDAYRPGALAGRGFGADALARLRPGIVHVRVSAFSQAGPWAPRRGYDTLVCAATGYGYASGERTPQRLPCQPLDYLTGYLGACGAMVALRRRALEGGSWQVTLSLDRTAAWLWEMSDALGLEDAAPSKPEPAAVDDLTVTTPSAFGELTHFPPMFDMPGAQPGWDRPPVPLGSDPPAWP